MNDFKLESAQRSYRQGLYDSAINTLKELLADDPNDAYCHGLLAANLLAQTRIFAAEYELKIALNLSPDVSFFHLIMARICIFKKKLKMALECCEQALALEVSNAEAFLTKSLIFLLLDKRTEALECIHHAARCDSGLIDVPIAFGEFYYATGDHDRALKFATEALHEDAQNEDANLLMGQLQLALGNIEDAEYHAKFVILQNPGNQIALNLFANIKMRKNIVFGLWWRFNAKVASFTDLKNGFLLISAYLIFNLLSLVAYDVGYEFASSGISYVWIALVVYSWLGIPYYHRMLKKELEKFSFNPNF